MVVQPRVGSVSKLARRWRSRRRAPAAIGLSRSTSINGDRTAVAAGSEGIVAEAAIAGTHESIVVRTRRSRKRPNGDGRKRIPRSTNEVCCGAPLAVSA
jgi:hypothetical protein